MIFISVRGISVRTTVVKYINNSNKVDGVKLFWANSPPVYAALHELSGRQ